MAENFEDVVKKLGSSVKKPSTAKAPAVLAVQMVDSKGKVIKEEKRGAAAAEAQREEEKRGKKTVKLWERIADALGGGKEGQKRDPKTGRFVAAGAGSGFLKSILPGLLPAGMIGMLGGASILGKLGLGAIALAGIWAAVEAIGDGLEGMEWAKSMGMEKESGFIARFFAGDIEGGLMNAFKQSMTGAAMGATLGMAGGPVGMIVGALLGAALFGIAGYFGAGALAKMIDPLVQDARKLFGLAINVTPEELKDAKAVAATTQQMKTDGITHLKKLTDQLTAARAATEPDQELIDSLIIQVSVASKASLEAHKKHEEAATKALELDRQAERNAVIAAEDAVSRNALEILRLNGERRRFEREVKLYGEDTLEGQVAAANLATIRVKLRTTRTEGETLREKEAAAEAVLLEEDRRLIKEAKEKGGTAPWRARFNVWTTDTWNDLKESWSSLKTWAVTWFANNIFDAGSGPVGPRGTGTSMRIFGVAIPSMKEIETKIKESWNSLKTGAISWFADNIFQAAPAGMTLRGAKIFGVAIPSMKEIETKIRESWSSLKTSSISWFADNIFDAGSGPAGPRGTGTPMRIFGVAMPSMKEIETKIRESWSTLKTWAVSWFETNIWSPAVGDTPAKLFGFPLSLPEITLPELTLPELTLPELTWPDITFPEVNWDAMMTGIGTLVQEFSDWIYTPGQDTGPSGRPGGGSSRAKIFGQQLPSINDLKLKTDFNITEMLFNVVKDIKQYFWNDDGKTGLLQFEFPDFKWPWDSAAVAEPEPGVLPRAAGGPIQAGRWGLVGELGPELILPNQNAHVLNAQRTQQMLQAGMLRGMGGGAGGGGITSINTGGNVVSSPTTNYVNNGIAARRPIILAA